MKHVFVFDQDKCSACSACMIGCMDQNDIDLAAGDKCFRQTFDNEVEMADGSVYCAYLSAACMHCSDAPCIAACPVGCLYKDPDTGFTVYDNTNCIGCKSCAMACPFGAPPVPRLRREDGQVRRLQRAGEERQKTRLCAGLLLRRPHLCHRGGVPAERQHQGLQRPDRPAGPAEMTGSATRHPVGGG